jgi:osmotically-inducible protein OsmY
MKTILGLLLLLAIAFGAYWFLSSPENREGVRETQSDLAEEARDLKESIRENLPDISLKTDDIREELERTGKVVRQKSRAAGEALADATADARTTGAIKAKFVADPDLSALSISVNTTQGIVTLSGTVSSHENIGKAIRIAMESEGVREVVSTLQVRQTK